MNNICLLRGVNMIFVLFTLFIVSFAEDMSVYTHTDPAIREPSPCEVCKYFATELMSRLKETSSKEVCY